jgi:hypothetical protein
MTQCSSTITSTTAGPLPAQHQPLPAQSCSSSTLWPNRLLALSLQREAGGSARYLPSLPPLLPLGPQIPSNRHAHQTRTP